MAEQHHSYTGLLLIGFAILVLLTAIFFTVAQTRVTATAEFKAGNSKLKSANNWLIAAYVLSYIATGVGVVLAILYFGHVTWGIGSEVVHGILFVLLFLHIILSGIFAFVALSDIKNSGVANNASAENWIWAGEVAALVAVIVIVISGAWRAHYVSTKSGQEKKLEAAMSMPPPPPPAQFEFTAPSTIVTGSASSPPPPPHSAPMLGNVDV